MYSKNIHFETMASNESIKRAVPLSSIKRGNTTREMDKNKKKKKKKRTRKVTRQPLSMSYIYQRKEPRCINETLQKKRAKL